MVNQIVGILLVAVCLIGTVRSQAFSFPVVNEPQQAWNIGFNGFPTFADCDTVNARSVNGASTSLLLTPPFTIEVSVTNVMGTCLPADEGVIFWYGNSTHFFAATIDLASKVKIRTANGGASTNANFTVDAAFRLSVSVTSTTAGTMFLTSQASAGVNFATVSNTLGLIAFPTFTAPTNFGFAAPVGVTFPFAVGGRSLISLTGILHEARIFNIAKNLAQIQADATVQLSGKEPNLLHLWRFSGDSTTDLVPSGTLPLTVNTAVVAPVTISTIQTNNFLIVPRFALTKAISADTASVSVDLISSIGQVSIQSVSLAAPNADVTFPVQTVGSIAGVASCVVTMSRKACGSTNVIGTPTYPAVPAVTTQNFVLKIDSSLNPGTFSVEILTTSDNIQLKTSASGGFGLVGVALDSTESITFNYRNASFPCSLVGTVGATFINCVNTGLPGAGNVTLSLCKTNFTVPFSFPAPTIAKVNALDDGKFEIIGTGFGSNRTFISGGDSFVITGPSVPSGYQCDAKVVSDTSISVICPNAATSLTIGQSYTVTLNFGGLESTSKFDYQICQDACVNGVCTGRNKCTCNDGFSGATCALTNTPIAAIAVPVAVGGVALIAAAIVGVIAYRRYKNPKRGGKTFVPLEKKDFTKIIYGESLLNNPSGKAPGDLLKLENYLLEDNLELAFAIANGTQITEADEIAKAMVTVFQSNNKVLPLLKAFVGDEVRNSDSSGTLFRSNSFVSKMFKFYSRLIALPYLYTTIGPEINELLEDKVGLEVDPEKIEKGTDLDQMRWTLMAQSQKILKQIVNSDATCPDEFKVLFGHLKECVAEKFPEQVNITIGGFIFLRFFCPAVSSPEAYGLSEEPPSQETRRLLILITKVLQNLSNDVEFGSKEMYMTKMNDFIQVNRGKISDFYKKLIGGAKGSATPLDMPRTARNAALYAIGNHLKDLDSQKKITDESSKKKIADIFN